MTNAASQGTDDQIQHSPADLHLSLKLFVEHASVAVAMFDRDMNYLAVSPGYITDYRPRRPDIVGRSHYDVFPETGDRWRDIHRRCLAGATEHNEQDLFRRTDGSAEWLQWEISPWYAKPGEIGGIILFSEVVTARVAAQAAQRESEERYRLLYETMAQGAVFQDADGRITHANPAAQRILGLSLNDLQGRTSIDARWKAVNEDGSDFAGDAHPAAVALHTGRAVHNVVMGVFNPRENGYRWIKIDAAPRFRPGETRPYDVFTTFDDITERRGVVQALRRSEEKYRGLMESLDSVVATVDQDGRFLYMNDVAAAQLGWPARDLIGKTMGELFPPPVAARQLQHVRQVMREDRSIVEEAQSFIQGVPRWYRTTIQPIHDEYGKVIHVLINSTDIHDLKQAQHDLQALNRTLEQRVAERTAEVQDLYDYAPIGYHSLDENGMYVRINQTELDWLGYSREEVLGRSFADFTTPVGKIRFQSKIVELTQMGAVRNLEYDMVRKDGSTFPCLINATGIYSADGVFVMSRSTMLDNTVGKQAADALQLANAEMERAVRLKDEFLANMSHELRTPLTGILALGENLLEAIYGPLNERQEKALRNIDISAQHLLSLINDLLDLSKIEAGRLELDLQPVGVNDICQASLVFVKEIAHKKEIKLSYTINHPAAVVLADARRLKQMLVNLLSNAVKFTLERGRVDLNVSVDADCRQIRFAVQDTGQGISVEDQARLFQPFTQLDNALTRKYEGTGLGLALVKRLVVQHRGTVTLASPPGGGTTATLRFPGSGK